MSRQRSYAFSRRSIIKAGGIAGAAAMLPRGARWADASTLLQDATPVAGGTLTFGTTTLPLPVISPIKSISSTQNYLIDLVYLRLVYGRAWGTGMNPDPNQTEFELGVAETMTEIETDRIWEFTLRENVFWHDGTPVTADDLILGIWLGINPDAQPTTTTSLSGILGANKLIENGGGSVTPPYNIAIDGVTKLGDRAVRIELETPLPNYWANWNAGFWPLPAHIYGNVPLADLFSEPYATKPIGNGPFKITNFVEGQYAEFEANPDFYLGRPMIDKYITRFGDETTLSAALESKEIDGAVVPPGPVYDRISQLPHLIGNPVAATLPIGLAVNYERFPDQGATLNKAMMYAIDVPTLSSQLFSNTLRPSNYLFEHVVGLETPPEGFPKYDYDPEKAIALLSEIGWDSNRTLDWIIWSATGPAEEAMQAMLEAVGIKTEYAQIDAAAVVSELYQKGNYDIVHANFQGSQDMEFNWVNIKCGASYDNGGYNYARYCNEKADELWQQALDTTVAAERKALFDQVSLELAAKPPQATLWRPSVGYVWNRRVKGVYPYQYQLPVRGPFERMWLDDEA